MAKIESMIELVIQKRINAAVESIFDKLANYDVRKFSDGLVDNGDDGDSEAVEPKWSDRRRNTGTVTYEETEPTQRRRKRGRGRASVAYIVKPYRGRGRRPMPALVPTWQRSWEAVKAAKGPVTAYEIEQATGDKKKTVESSLFQLRRLGLVKSEKIGAVRQ